MPSPQVLSPHLSRGHCFRCAEDASKYNHCSWCGDDFQSHIDLVEHWHRMPCGAHLVNYLADKKVIPI